MRNRYFVVSSEGYQLFGPRSMEACTEYLRSAYALGSEPGNLRIVPAEDCVE